MIYCLLQQCAVNKDRNAGRRVYALMVRSGLNSSAFLGDHLIRMCALCWSLPATNQAFCNISKPSIYRWNAIISAHVRLGKCEQAFETYHKMQQEGSEPDRLTFLCILKACSSMGDIGQGRKIHDQVINSGLCPDLAVSNSLMNMYAKCGNLEAASTVFNNLPNRDVVSWGVIITGHVQRGLGQRAVQLFERMQEEDIKPNRVIFLCILKACGRIGCIGQGRLVHYQIMANGLESEVVIGNSLIDMYAKCGWLWEANKMFDLLPNRDLVSYGAMIAGYVEHGQSFPAFELFERSLHESIKLNKFIFVCLLKACSKAGALGKGRQIHDQTCKNGLESDVVLGNILVEMYAKCGCLDEARRVFDCLPTRDVVSWGAMIEEYAKHGRGLCALELFEYMQEDEILPNKVVFFSLLKACSSIRAHRQGRGIHEHVIRSGIESDVVVGSTIVDMYAKCDNLEEAHDVFDKLPDPNMVSWGALVMGYAQHGYSTCALELHNKMQQKGIKPDEVIFLSILKACGSIWQGRLIHIEIIKIGFEADIILGNALIDMYAKCGSLDEAYKVFHDMKNHDVVSWGAMLAGYVENGHAFHAFELFGKLQMEGIEPNNVIYLYMLKACGSIGTLGQARFVHEQIFKSGLESDVIVGSTLIDMYAKCGGIDEAHNIFDGLSDRNVVSWGAIIAGYAQQCCSPGVFQLLEKMQQEGIKPNKVICTCILKACGGIKAIGQGRYIHDLIKQERLELDVYIGSTLVDMYVKCGKIEEARMVFEDLPHRNSVSWGEMIAGYALHGHGLVALELYEEMKDECIQPDEVTCLSILKACSSIGAIIQGRQVHEEIIKGGFESDLVVGNSLLDMYANCGSMEEAHQSFDRLLTRDLVSWGTMITGYACHGNPMLARQCMKDMQRDHVAPDAVIFTSVLAACNQAGLLGEARWYFNSMKHDHGIMPSIEHYNCLVDLLGCAGQLNEAEDLLQTMPFSPDIVGWRSLLTACKTYGNIWLGKRCLDQIIQLDGKDASGYMLMSYLYANVRKWEDVDKMEELRKCAVASKKPGITWIEVHNKVHEFVVADPKPPRGHGTHHSKV